jgi:hypothetical protein
MRTFKSSRTRRREAVSARCSRMGKASQRVQAAKRMEGPPRVYPPMRGDLLMVDRVTNELQGASVAYEIRVGDRLNRIDVYSFGRLIEGVHTWTKFFDLRRRRMAVKWLFD